MAAWTLQAHLVAIVRESRVPGTAFALRGTCKDWRSWIDAIGCWRDMLVAAGVPIGLASQHATAADARLAYSMICCAPRPLLQRCRRHGKTAYWANLDDAEWSRIVVDIEALLDWVCRVGEESAVRWGRPINDVLPKTALLEDALSVFPIIRTACCGPKRRARFALAEFWKGRSQRLADQVAERSRSLSVSEKEAAEAVVRSIVKKVEGRMLCS